MRTVSRPEVDSKDANKKSPRRYGLPTSGKGTARVFFYLQYGLRQRPLDLAGQGHGRADDGVVAMPMKPIMPTCAGTEEDSLR